MNKYDRRDFSSGLCLESEQVGEIKKCSALSAYPRMCRPPVYIDGKLLLLAHSNLERFHLIASTGKIDPDDDTLRVPGMTYDLVPALKDLPWFPTRSLIREETVE